MRLMMVAALGAAIWQQGETFTHKRAFCSPDGKLVARIAPVSVKDGHPARERVVEIRTRKGRVLARRTYKSRDGEHGYGVVHTGWTPNSRFFVWSMESSGGHSPWHFPTDFWSRRDNRIYSLDRLVNGSVTSDGFQVSPPDRIRLRLKGSTVTEGVRRTLRLGRLVRK